MKKNVAITIQNFIQFYSIKQVIDRLMKDNINVELFVPKLEDNRYNNIGTMFDEIYSYLVENNYIVKRNVPNKKYKILLEPYPMDIYFKFNCEYRIKYLYSIISAKPHLTYRESDCFCYDAILVHSTYEEELLSVYSKTYLVEKPMYCDFKRTRKNVEKKTLVYLPTYGDLTSVNMIHEELYKLKKKYRIITKEHHGTNYLDYEKKNSKLLKENFDEFYDSSKPLAELLSIADVVLTDNSGSIFDSMYNNIPVAVFAKDLESCSLKDIDSCQYQLIKNKIIPYTKDPRLIDKIIEEALSKEILSKQRQVNKRLFPQKGQGKTQKFIDVIYEFLNDNINISQIKLHRNLYKEYTRLLTEANKLSLITNELKELKMENSQLIDIKNEYQGGKLYKMASKIYSIKSKIIGGKK